MSHAINVKKIEEKTSTRLFRHMSTFVTLGFFIAIFCAVLTPAYAANEAVKIDHVEPPHWWVGMKNTRLQIMLHGANITQFQPSIAQAGVRIDRVTRTTNPNYLFIDLQISADTKAGMLPIVLQSGSQTQIIQYELKTREAGSAQRVGFSSADVVYNLMPDRFANGNPANDNAAGYTEQADRSKEGGRHGGDIQGIINHLDYIADMGFTAIWPTPMTETNQPSFSYHGYGATNTYKIDPRYGSNDDYKRLVKTARSKGICVLQDLVPNHIGNQHWWMKDLPADDWLGYDNKPVITNHARNSVSDPYASEVDKKRFSSGWFDTTLPDINQGNPLVATYQIQNAIWWIEEAGLCGLRVDTYAYSNKAFTSTWTKRILDEYPRLNIVGEEWSDNPVVQAYWMRGKTQADGFVSYAPSIMDFVLQGSLRTALSEKESFNTGFIKLYNVLVNDQIYPDPGNQMLFDGNHDTPRIASALDDDPALVRMALAYVLTMKRVPQIYYGSEILLPSPKQHNAFDAFRADFPGGWAGDKVNAFTGKGLSAEQASLQSWLRTLLQWRKTQTVIHQGDLRHYVPEDGTYVYFRFNAKNTVMVAFNKSAQEQTLKTERFREVLPVNASGVDVFSQKKFDLQQSFSISPRSVLILQITTQK